VPEDGAEEDITSVVGALSFRKIATNSVLASYLEAGGCRILETCSVC